MFPPSGRCGVSSVQGFMIVGDGFFDLSANGCLRLSFIGDYRLSLTLALLCVSLWKTRTFSVFENFDILKHFRLE